MSYLLDTNVCIAYLNNPGGLRARISALEPKDVCVCSVVKGELLYGARKSGRVEANLARLRGFFEPLRSLPFDDDAAARYGVIRAQLEREGRPMGGNDLLIAAIAATHDATLVPRDTARFERVVGLRVEHW
jgi:tRNA(fMet)-specific endonuclease VapC